MASYRPVESNAIRNADDTNDDGDQGGEEELTRNQSYGTVHGIEDGTEATFDIEQGRGLLRRTIFSFTRWPRLVMVVCLAVVLLAAAAAWGHIIGRVIPTTIPGGVMDSCAKPPVLWADEFDGSDLDLAKWSHQNGDGCDFGLCGWGNAEWEWYSPDNLRVENGHLVMEARREDMAEELSRSSSEQRYTSSKILTKGKGDFGPVGRFEVRMRLPRGQGIWPAFWMLPTDDVYGSWPKSGEIDIMENIGKEGPNTIHGTIHYGQDSPKDQYSEEGIFLDAELYGDFSESFHDFAVEREEGIIRWFIDDTLYSTKTRSDIAPYLWPFDERFFFILNVAVGGNWPGNPDNTTIFPQRLDVDYVRVYNGNFPRIDGKQTVLSGESGIQYTFVGGGATNFMWSVPDNAVITIGQGTEHIIVNFGLSGGIVSVRWDWISADCSSEQGSSGLRVKALDVASFKKYPFNCGCPERCTEAVLNRDADGYTCGDRIQWLMDEMGRTEKEACATISHKEFNGRCSPCFPD